MIKIKLINSIREINLPLPSNIHNVIHGNCLIFAKFLKRRLPGSSLKAFMIFDGSFWTVAHVVVEYNGKFYDGSGIFEPERYFQYQQNSLEDIEEFSIVDYHPLRWDANLNNGPEIDDEELEGEFMYDYGCSRSYMLRHAKQNEGGEQYPDLFDEAKQLAAIVAKRIKNDQT